MNKKYLSELVCLTGLLFKTRFLMEYLPLCMTYTNDYDLGKEIRKLSMPDMNKKYPNDYDLGSYMRKMVMEGLK